MTSYLPKILTTDQVRSVDKYTIEHEPIDSIDLMERAARAAKTAIDPIIAKGDRVAIVAGPGNNGGDALALARLYRAEGTDLDVFVVPADSRSPDCAANLDRLQHGYREAGESQRFEDYDVIIDGIFGSGLDRPVQDSKYAAVVEAMNRSSAYVVSIDLPSGLFADSQPDPEGSIVQADHVVTFQRPKLIELLAEGAPYIGTWQVVDIGLDEHYMMGLAGQNYYLDDRVKDLLPLRSRYSHKGSYGHLLLMAGATGKAGAAVLSARAACRSGAGLVTVATPRGNMPILQTAVPEAMAIADPHQDVLTHLPDLSPYQAIAVGPGIGTNGLTAAMVDHLLVQASGKKVVFDADALNIISEQGWQQRLPTGAVLTPHPKEMQRLVGDWSDSWERMKVQREMARRYNAIVVYKDAHTCIADAEGNLFFNTTGNPGMATGGTGDVLTGIVGGLLAQGCTPLTSALLAVYFHGLAGDASAMMRGEAAVIASDLIEHFSFDD